MVTTKKQASLVCKNVIIANVINRSAHGLTLVEKRILMAAIAKMEGVFQPVRISCLEYAETYGIIPRVAYQQLKESAQSFRKRYIAVKEAGVNWEINWLSAIAYPDNMGYIEIEFNYKLMPYLCDLEAKFTHYKLNQTCALRSIYSWRILELFEQMLPKSKKSGWLIIKLEDFHHAMQATTTHIKNFNQTKTKIIEPALNELVKKDNWEINWEPIKEGRKVTRLSFSFKKK